MQADVNTLSGFVAEVLSPALHVAQRSQLTYVCQVVLEAVAMVLGCVPQHGSQPRHPLPGYV